MSIKCELQIEIAKRENVLISGKLEGRNCETEIRKRIGIAKVEFRTLCRILRNEKKKKTIARNKKINSKRLRDIYPATCQSMLDNIAKDEGET